MVARAIEGSKNPEKTEVSAEKKLSNKNETDKSAAVRKTGKKGGKRKISAKRIFNKQPYFTDFRKYESKETARELINYLKKEDRSVKARVVQTKQGVYIYFDEDTFNRIKSGDITVPHLESVKKDQHNRASEIKTTPPSIGSDENRTQQRNRQQDRSDKEKSKETSAREDVIGVSDEKSPLHEEKLVRPYVPAYLFNRLSKEARRIFNIGLLEIEKTPPKKLERYIDILRSEQIKYEIGFEKERPIVEYMIKLSNIMAERLERYREEEARIFFDKYIRLPFKNGKFKKLMAKFDKLGLDEVAYRIFKSVKGKIKKYPYSETVLLKQIRRMLEEVGNTASKK